MFVRFVVDESDPVSQRRLGIFHSLRHLRDDEQLTNDEEKEMNAVMSWFSTHLQKPQTFSAGRRHSSADKALSWYKDNAVEHIAKMRSIAKVVENHGIRVHTIKTNRPGYIVYEDEYQIVAEPFSETQA